MYFFILWICLLLTSCSVPVGVSTDNHIVGTRVDGTGNTIEQIEIHHHSVRNQVIIGPDGPVTRYGYMGKTIYRIDKKGYTQLVDFFNLEGKDWYFQELSPLTQYGYWFALIQVGSLGYDNNRYAEDKIAIIFNSEGIVHKREIPGCLRLVTRGDKEEGNFRIVTPFWKALRNDITSSDDLNWKIDTENNEAVFSTTSGIVRFDLTDGTLQTVSARLTSEVAEAEFERQIILYKSEERKFFNDAKKLFKLAYNAEFALDNGFLITAKSYSQLMNEILPDYERRPIISWWGANGLHAMYMTLGRIAMLDDDVEAAKHYLIKSGEAGCPSPISIEGPDMRLANQIVETENRQTVIEYLDGIKECWNGKENADLWVRRFENGELPSSTLPTIGSRSFLGQFIHVVQANDSIPVLRVDNTYQTENDSGIVPLVKISERFTNNNSKVEIGEEIYDFFLSGDNKQFLKIGNNFGLAHKKFEYDFPESCRVYSSTREHSSLNTTCIMGSEGGEAVPTLIYLLVDNHGLGEKFRTIKVIFHQNIDIPSPGLQWDNIAMLTDFQKSYIEKFISDAKSAITIYQ